MPPKTSSTGSAALAVVLVDDPAHPLAPEDIARLVPPGAGLEVVVVAVGGRPPASPVGVTVVHSTATTLAGARNEGQAVVSSPMVAFLDAEVEVVPDWHVRATDVLHMDPSVAAVALVPHNGSRPALSFTGHRLPDVVGGFGEVDVLFAPSAAMVVRVDAFRAAGGFDASLGVPGSDIDLGWRLWLRGYRVRSCPGALAAAPVVADRFATDRAAAERDALRTIYSSYDDRTLGAVLPAAMSLAVRRAASAGDEALVEAARGISMFVSELPSLVARRAQIQDGRGRSDDEIVGLFGRALQPVTESERDDPSMAAVLDAMGVSERLGGRRRVLVVTADVLTRKMAGPAIRAWQISKRLAQEHEVVLASTNGTCDITGEGFSARSANTAELVELERWCDILVVQGYILDHQPVLRLSRKVMVVDIYDPLHLENLELSRSESGESRRLVLRHAVGVLNDQLVRGDFFMCASNKQRDFWLGQLAALGRVNPITYDDSETLERLIDVVPFGLPDTMPERTGPGIRGVTPGISDDDEVLLWGGGIYNWFDPLTLIRAVDRLRRRRPKVRLYFLGLKHPNPEVPQMRMAVECRRLAEDLGLVGTHVFFNEGWVAYDERQNYLLDADVGVSTHLDHVETAFSFRTRILDYIWTALPIVATAGDGFADLIEAETLGAAVPAGDVDALEAALFRLLDDRELNAICRKNLESVRARFTWSEVLTPLVEFCRSPRRAPDLVDADMAHQIGVWDRPGIESDHGLVATARLAARHLRDGGPRYFLSKVRMRLGRALHALG